MNSPAKVVNEHAHHLYFMLDIASKQAITLQLTMMKARNFTNLVEEKIVDRLIEDIHNLNINLAALRDTIGDGQ